MLRDEAVTRINDGLGFRPTGHSLTTNIVSRLMEAQDELEMGKTLPKFLLQEDQTFVLPLGAHQVALPVGFARAYDDAQPRYYAPNSQKPLFIKRRHLDEGQRAYLDTNAVAPAGPKIYVIRRTSIDFIVNSDRAYTITWDYYKYATSLATNIENEWLADKSGKWWLIGEAGMKIAADLRDQNAAAIFSAMASKAKNALMSNIYADEQDSGPRMMGANL